MNKRYTRHIGCLLLGLIAILLIFHATRYFVKKYTSTQIPPVGMSIASTPAMVENIRPVGELYLFTAITEDVAKDTFMGSGFLGTGLWAKKHLCLQLLRQQVSFTMDMSKVKYETDSITNTLRITLPEPKFVQSTIYSWFKSDNENEEGAVGYDASPLIDKIEARIRHRYNTPQNRAAAIKNAQDILTSIFEPCGKQIIFN